MTGKDDRFSIKAVRAWMVGYVRSVLDLPADRPDTAARFDTYGLDSVEAVIMAGVMEEEFGVTVDAMEFFNNPSIDQFAAFFAAAHAKASG